MSLREISQYLRIPKHIVEYHNNNKSKSTAGRKQKLNNNMMNTIEEQIRNDNSISLAAMEGLLYENYNINVGKSTLLKYLKIRGYKSVIAKNKPSLKRYHKRKRYRYCKKNPNYFQNVVFVDESTFQIEPNKISVWTKKNNRNVNPQENIHYFQEQSKIKQNFCAGIKPGNQNKVFIVTQTHNMGQYSYLDVLSNSLIPAANSLTFNNFKIQQDNAPYHNSKLVKRYLKDNYIKLLKQLPKFPDLNPIKRVWHLMKFYVNQENPTT
jgi:transposase